MTKPIRGRNLSEIEVLQRKRMKMKIAIGADHVGYELKKQIIALLEERGHEVEDVGTYSDVRCDYPLYGHSVAQKIASHAADKGILICGTGVGISIAANKVRGIRAVVCSEPLTAQMAVRHNDANILAFGARIIGVEMAKNIVECWLDAEFERGRHIARIAAIEGDF